MEFNLFQLRERNKVLEEKSRDLDKLIETLKYQKEAVKETFEAMISSNQAGAEEMADFDVEIRKLLRASFPRKVESPKINRKALSSKITKQVKSATALEGDERIEYLLSIDPLAVRMNQDIEAIAKFKKKYHFL